MIESKPYVPHDNTVEVRQLRKHLNIVRGVGQFFLNKYRDQAVERGYRAAAANMRKQGVPLGVALRALLGTTERLWPWDQPAYKRTKVS